MQNATENEGREERRTYVCKECGSDFTYDNDDDFYEWGEEQLWGHIQLDHPEIYQECQTWETPDMLDVYFDEIRESEVHGK